MTDPREKSIRTRDGLTLRTEAFGPAGGPPLLLVMGAMNPGLFWPRVFCERLATAGFLVIRYDHRDTGGSSTVDYAAHPYTLTELTDDALAILDGYGIARADVMGYSMGARITAFLAIRHPERIRRIVFGGLGINMVRGMAGTGPIAHALEAPTIDDVTNPTARTFRAFAEQTKSDLKALATCIRSSRAKLTAEAVATIAHPVLVAVGEHDVIAGDPGALAAIMPNARAFVIPGREHMKAVGDKAYKDAVLGFLGEP